MSLLCGAPGGPVTLDATRVTTHNRGGNNALWITARAIKCLWIARVEGHSARGGARCPRRRGFERPHRSRLAARTAKGGPLWIREVRRAVWRAGP